MVQQGDHSVPGRGINKQLYPFHHPTLAPCAQHHLAASGLNMEWGRGCSFRPQRESQLAGGELFSPQENTDRLSGASRVPAMCFIAFSPQQPYAADVCVIPFRRGGV